MVMAASKSCTRCIRIRTECVSATRMGRDDKLDWLRCEGCEDQKPNSLEHRNEIRNSRSILQGARRPLCSNSGLHCRVPPRWVLFVPRQISLRRAIQNVNSWTTNEVSVLLLDVLVRRYKKYIQPKVNSSMWDIEKVIILNLNLSTEFPNLSSP